MLGKTENILNLFFRRRKVLVKTDAMAIPSPFENLQEPLLSQPVGSRKMFSSSSKFQKRLRTNAYQTG
jgi:hypothetical protein